MLKQILLEIDEPCSHNCDIYVCDACKLGKSYRILFIHIHKRSSQTFQSIHVDVWGVSLVIVDNSVKYFILFVDDHTIFYYFSDYS